MSDLIRCQDTLRLLKSRKDADRLKARHKSAHRLCKHVVAGHVESLTHSGRESVRTLHRAATT